MHTKGPLAGHLTLYIAVADPGGGGGGLGSVNHITHVPEFLKFFQSVDTVVLKIEKRHVSMPSV